MYKAGNTFKLKIDVEEAGNELRVELVSATYTVGSSVKTFKFQDNVLKIEYSEDRKTDDVVDLTQKLEVDKEFTVRTEYNRRKDETKIEIHTFERLGKFPAFSFRKWFEHKIEKYTVDGMWILGARTSLGEIGCIPPD